MLGCRGIYYAKYYFGGKVDDNRGKKKKKKVCRAGNEKGKGKKEKMSLKYFTFSRGDLD